MNPTGFEWETPQAAPVGGLAPGNYGATPNGSLLTVIPDGAVVDLQGPASPLAGIWSGCLVIPFNFARPGDPIRVQHDLRVSVHRSPGSSAIVSIRYAGILRETEFPDRPHTKDAGWVGRWTHRWLAPAQGAYVVALGVFACRSDVDAAVLVRVDSLDLRVA